MHKKVLLIILDGWGIGKKNKYNAIYLAKTPFFDHCWHKDKTSQLKASGKAVGLLNGQMGSSEVGHMHIGAGRIITQELTKIKRSLQNQSFLKNIAFLKACNWAKKHNSKLHLVGIVSDGGIHSHIDHIFALLKLAKQQEMEQVYIHCFLDGRDTPPTSGLKYISALMLQIKKIGIGKIATICGRFYLDRDQNWKITQKAVNLLTKGYGNQFRGFKKALRFNYQNKIFDEFIAPITLNQVLIKEYDSLICFHFRADRMRQLVAKLRKQISNLFITTMIDYGINDINSIAYQREVPQNHLCEILSKNKIQYLKITETQKYPHLSYFFNGTREEPYPYEKRIMIPSKQVKHFNKAPEMSAHKITDKALLNLGNFQVIILNFANGDMVGHSGDIKAGIKACECVDRCLKRLCTAAKHQNYQIIITADHGNVEEMYDFKNDHAHTAHTANPVPFILLCNENSQLKPKGSLVNIAPTVLELLGIKKPYEMKESLLISN